MCGIAGILYADPERSVSPLLLKQMTDRLVHRGPDDGGHFHQGNVGLGHRRLSIIDAEGGHQPMSNADGSIWITFNGEIYNFVELRERLKKQGIIFKTRSDTEILLALYEQKGPECLQDLNGMFAFGIIDFRKKQFFAARDRFGIKPFYFYHDPEKFVFASEIKAILTVQAIKSKVNFDAVQSYIDFQFSLDDQTFYQNIRRLMPGQSLSLDLFQSSQPALKTYWDLDFDHLKDQSINETLTQLQWLLEDSVKIQLRSDVPVGCHLSGGIDSSLISSLASQHLGQSFKTFTGAFSDGPDYDETPWARSVSKKIGSEYHEVFPTHQDFVGVLPKLIYFMDEPAAGPGLFPQYFVSRLAASHVKVVLGGQGGDEIFAGYTRYLIAYFEECIKGAIFETQQSEDKRFVVTFRSILPNLPTLKEYVPLLQYFWSDGLFSDQNHRYFRLIHRGSDMAGVFSKDFLKCTNGQTAFDHFRARFDSLTDRSFINKMTHFDIKTLLPALLQVEDRVSMACSLESRVPLLDHRIAELMASVPPKIKFHGGKTKHLIREAATRWLQNEILNRKDKKGFPVPLVEWFQGPLKGFVQEILLSKTARERGIYDTDSISHLISNERKYGRSIWGLLNLELWFQQFGDHLPS